MVDEDISRVLPRSGSLALQLFAGGVGGLSRVQDKSKATETGFYCDIHLIAACSYCMNGWAMFVLQGIGRAACPERRGPSMMCASKVVVAGHDVGVLAKRMSRHDEISECQ